MAVSVGVLVEVILMVFLCGIEVAERLHFDNDRCRGKCLLLGKDFLDDGEVGL